MMGPVLYIFLSLILLSGAEFGDEMHVYEKQCLGEDKFHCRNGDCIPIEKYCNGMPDCGDASDEDFCPNHAPDVTMCKLRQHFMCHDKKKCLPQTWVCNNATDCDDGSDELNCAHTPDEVTDWYSKWYKKGCKGFMCDSTTCISTLWACDGVYDCIDRTDENIDTCRHTKGIDLTRDGINCVEHPDFYQRHYRCNDSSFCVPLSKMCDGLKDCRDGSDEEGYCKKWSTMCTNTTCSGDAICLPTRWGPECVCGGAVGSRRYNNVTKRCENVLECDTETIPICSHYCTQRNGSDVHCRCETGYKTDQNGYLCYAPDPEPLLFYTTRTEIRYVALRSRFQKIVATGLEETHGVVYDGEYVYWVETAEGNQGIMRAHINSTHQKQTLVSIGLESPDNIDIDYLGGNIYFSDSERGTIGVCRTDGSICAIIGTPTKNPKFITLHVERGLMYWADWDGSAFIMKANMDGTNASKIVTELDSYPTGLALDAINERLYFIDKTIKVVKLRTNEVYALLQESYIHAYAAAVFENTVYWSDWAFNNIRSIEKTVGNRRSDVIVDKLNFPALDIHIYHPLLFNRTKNPCKNHSCPHLCILKSSDEYVCKCADGFQFVNNECEPLEHMYLHSLMVGAGKAFTQIHYNTFGNPETKATTFNIGRVQAMAYNKMNDTLYIYDGQRKTINFIYMKEFTLGISHIEIAKPFANVMDMDYDYVTNCLYILDTGSHRIEVYSLYTKKQTSVYIFYTHELPISFCVVPEYGKMLVAVTEINKDGIYIESIGLNGKGRKRLDKIPSFKGPRVRLRYSDVANLVYISDESHSIIETIHPEGTSKSKFLETPTSIFGLAVTDAYAFWTNRYNAKLYWANVHESTPKVRRLNLTIFPENSPLHLQTLIPVRDLEAPIFVHPCHLHHTLCSEICVQTAHAYPEENKVFLDYACLCSPRLYSVNGKCVEIVHCGAHEFFCHKSNHCFPKSGRCDGKKDCDKGEDEEGCQTSPNLYNPCATHEILCYNRCINRDEVCKPESTTTSLSSPSPPFSCNATYQFKCKNEALCIERSQLCDGKADCTDKSDEDKEYCDTLTCFDTEFMCGSGSCILSSFRCDGEDDCIDGSDEYDCDPKTCRSGENRCQNGQCIVLLKRCDGHLDCDDESDEDDCGEPVITTLEETPKCPSTEYTCQLNTSICLPPTVRCNGRVDCPGGTDERDCEECEWMCKPENLCISKSLYCDGKRDCVSGWDETPMACAAVKKKPVPPKMTTPMIDDVKCLKSYMCRKRKQCVLWTDVCDGNPDCDDNTDEGHLCKVACKNDTCNQICHKTPYGPQCSCNEGYYKDKDDKTCVDIDECEEEACSQMCHNTPGSYHCSCYPGYALGIDRSTCKAIRGTMSIIYLSGNKVHSITNRGDESLIYTDERVDNFTGMDYSNRDKALYLTSAETGRLLYVYDTVENVIIGSETVSQRITVNVTVTNIGRPTKIAVDWVTDNVYFVDSTVNASYIRVCNVKVKKCAKLQKIPDGGKVTALVVDPSVHRMFYCVNFKLESSVWSATFGGKRLVDLLIIRNCTGLAVDSFQKRLYVAETGPQHIFSMDYNGQNLKKALHSDVDLQAPHSLVIFEGYMFFLTDNSYKLSHCELTYKECKPYVYRMFDVSTIVIRHEMYQRGDLTNYCEGYSCNSICVFTEDNNPQCLCNDGSLTDDGNCALPDALMLPVFDDEKPTASHLAWFLTLGIITTVMVIYAIVRYQTRRINGNRDIPVRFMNVSGRDPSTSEEDVILGLQTETEDCNQFTNPVVEREMKTRKGGPPDPGPSTNVVLHSSHSDDTGHLVSIPSTSFI